MLGTRSPRSYWKLLKPWLGSLWHSCHISLLRGAVIFPPVERESLWPEPSSHILLPSTGILRDMSCWERWDQTPQDTHCVHGKLWLQPHARGFLCSVLLNCGCPWPQRSMQSTRGLGNHRIDLTHLSVEELNICIFCDMDRYMHSHGVEFYIHVDFKGKKEN